MATSGSKSISVTSYDTLKFSWERTSYSVANNTSTISWKMQLISDANGRISSTASKSWSVTVNGKKYSGTNTVGIAASSTKTLASGTTTISHNSDGTKTFSYSFSQEFSITFSGSNIGTKSGSGSGTLNTIPRASSLTASNGTLGTAQTLTISRHDSSFKHKITYTCGSVSGYAAGSSSGFTTETSIPWTPPLSLASENTTGTSVSVTLYLKTYNSSGTQIGSTVSKTITCSIPASCKPTCSVAVSDAAGYFEDYGVYIKGLSKFKVTITPTLSYSSPIASYKGTANGSTYTASSFTTDVLKSSGTLSITATVTDKRGRTSSAATKSVTVVDYKNPQISTFNAYRCDSNGVPNKKGNRICVEFNASATNVNGKNSANGYLAYKKTSDTSWTDAGTFPCDQNCSFTFDADIGSSYDIQLTVTDKFKSTSNVKKVPTAQTLWSIFRNGLGFAFGKIAELENVFDIGFKTRFSGGILHPVLEAGTNIDEVRTPNTYVGKNVSSNNYSGNFPISSGTFTLDVVSAGEEGQVKQRLTECKKTDARAWERFYYQSSWGEWVCVSDYSGRLLWSGAYYMTAGHTATLSEPISKQKNGVVLVFSAFDVENSKASDWHWNLFFIPKYFAANNLSNEGGTTFVLAGRKFTNVASKYLYIYDDKITGNDDNNLSGTSNGITYSNKNFVLRYVIGV